MSTKQHISVPEPNSVVPLSYIGPTICVLGTTTSSGGRHNGNWFCHSKKNRTFQLVWSHRSCRSQQIGFRHCLHVCPHASKTKVRLWKSFGRIWVRVHISNLVPSSPYIMPRRHFPTFLGRAGVHWFPSGTSMHTRKLKWDLLRTRLRMH